MDSGPLSEASTSAKSSVGSAVFAAETHELPLLWFLFYARSGGSLDSLIATSGGAQERRVVGGSHILA